MTLLVSVLLGVLGGGMLGWALGSWHGQEVGEQRGGWRVRTALNRISDLERELQNEKQKNRMYYRPVPLHWSTIDSLCGRETYTEETEQS